MQQHDFDYIVIGSGFGGSVSAHRLTEKGYRVGVLEMGKRYTQDDFPETNWHLKKFLWGPALGLHGFFRMSLFRHAWVLSGVGVGGGSLVYACTSLVPPDTVWDQPSWSGLNDWRKTMPAHYAEASRMLGVTSNPYLGPGDKLLREAADAQGFGDTFYPTRVAVYFGPNGETVPDPFFGGEGPARTGCTYCGGCMVGCRFGAKNTLDKNYLYFAEKAGARVIPETKVVDVVPLNGRADGADGYAIHTVSSTRRLSRARQVYTARGVVFSAGVLGTVNLLLQARSSGSLPRLSDRVGHFVRTNSESILGVKLDDKTIDVSEGIAIGSGIYIDDHTHIEAVRYSKGSDALGATATILAQGRPWPGRILSWLGVLLQHPVRSLKMLNPKGFAQSSVILLVMQTLDAHLQMRRRRSWLPPFGMKLTTQGERVPTNIPQANAFAEQMARQVGGTPMTALTEILFDVPTTAHILGGAVMGATPATGVVDARNRVFNYRNLYVCDGSMIAANLGVNPSLTITALTEQAMAGIPNAAEVEPAVMER